MKNLDKGSSGSNAGFSAASYAAISKKQSQVHFYVYTDLYKKLKRIGIAKDKSIGCMFNEMLLHYLNNNTDY